MTNDELEEKLKNQTQLSMNEAFFLYKKQNNIQKLNQALLVKERFGEFFVDNDNFVAFNSWKSFSNWEFGWHSDGFWFGIWASEWVVGNETSLSFKVYCNKLFHVVLQNYFGVGRDEEYNWFNLPKEFEHSPHFPNIQQELKKMVLDIIEREGVEDQDFLNSLPQNIKNLLNFQ